MSKTPRPILSTSVSRRHELPTDNAKLPAKKASGKPGRRQLEQHEASLIPSIRSRAPVNIVLLDGTRLEEATLVGFDRYTIAIEYDGCRETIFKSAISRIIMPYEV